MSPLCPEMPDVCPPRPRGENFCFTPYLGDTTASPTGGVGAGPHPSLPRPVLGHTPSMRNINFSCGIGDAATERGLSVLVAPPPGGLSALVRRQLCAAFHVLSRPENIIQRKTL